MQNHVFLFCLTRQNNYWCYFAFIQIRLTEGKIVQQCFCLMRQNSNSFLAFPKGSVYFTAKMLAATDQLEKLCHQSNIRSHAMTQYKEKVTLSGTHYPARGVMVRSYGCYANGWRFNSHLAEFLLFFPGCA